MSSAFSRRQFLKLAGLAGLGLSATGATLASSQATTNNVELTQIDIEINDLPRVFAGFRLGFISDLHLGLCTPVEVIESAIALLQGAEPDLVLIGGDLIWVADQFLSRASLAAFHGQACQAQGRSYESDRQNAAKLYALAGDLLGGLKPAYGMCMVYGNHDQWVLPGLCRNSMSKAGIQVLLNTVFPVERQGKRLLVLGSDDYWTGIPSTSAMPDKKEPGQVRIVLSHNPDYLSHLLEKTRFEFDLGLSGHTHGGQIKLPLIGALHYNIKDQRFAEGLFSHPRAVTYTSRGIGVVGLPIRINCPPEVNVFTLKRA